MSEFIPEGDILTLSIAEGEKLLGEIVKEKYGSEFVFLTNFPFAIRPFYHMIYVDFRQFPQQARYFV